MKPLQNIYRGREFKYYDDFMNLRHGLLEDFFKQFPGFKETEKYDFGGYYHSPGGWRVIPLKYNWNALGNQVMSRIPSQEEIKSKYPTGFYNIVERFGDDCVSAGYTVLCPGSILGRHTGKENRHAKNIRIHIPLLVPEGDIGFEIYGEQIDWSDLFAFDNQLIHSAWNLTDKPRLVFLVDMLRSACDIPDGIPWTQESEDNAPPFPKTNYADRK